MSSFNVTVCELPDDPDDLDTAWQALRRHQISQPAELIVLNEVPFDAWFGTTPDFDEARWSDAMRQHARRLAQLREWDVAVLGTAPYELVGTRYNRSFLHRGGDTDAEWWRRKSWIPDEDPVWEASWYSAAPDTPDDLRTVAGCRLGVLICTELWAMDWAKQLGVAGAHIIASPRASGVDSTDNWLAAGRVAAIVSGSYSVSSNRTGNGFGGAGWVFAPDGELLARTTESEPFVTVSLDLSAAEEAKGTYPRYALWSRRWLDTPAPGDA